ncbi:Alpha/Beta hydrolase protein [Dactylonectria estremocensis]|uniref:Alpha/Beta hydrolase protein n=1 Tax=Dactylonectria estremocensis TaxID=1079267 RepID=A0A9P9DWF9_9HYPO|nr:Alpha/Beta hydrolase protein [Dactylonectria estremocensis]
MDPAKTASSQDPHAQQFVLADGRTLSYATYGASSPSSYAFYFHSYPASRLEGATLHDAAVAHGIQVIAVDRPGMGASTFQPRRRILDWPLDVTALANHLHIPQFACIGCSGGGPYVLACYHKIPRTRLKAAMIVAGIWPNVLGTQGMLFELRVMLALAPWVPGLVAAGLDYSIGRAARDTEHPEVFAATMGKMMESRPEVDAAIWREDVGGFREALLANLREALKPGTAGAAHEVKLFGSDWGFALDDVKVEDNTLTIWHGGLDQNVPLAMAEKAKALLPGCQFQLFPQEGHASLIARKAIDYLAQVKVMMES